MKKRSCYSDESVWLFTVLFVQGLEAIKYPVMANLFACREGIEFDYECPNPKVLRDKIIDYLIKKTLTLASKGEQ